MTLSDGSVSDKNFNIGSLAKNSHMLKDTDVIRQVKYMMDDEDNFGLSGLILINDKGETLLRIIGRKKGKWRTIEFEEGEQIIGFDLLTAKNKTG